MEHVTVDSCRALWIAVLVEAIRHAHNPWRHSTSKRPPAAWKRKRLLEICRRDFDTWIYSRDGGEVIRLAGLDDSPSTRELLKARARDGLPEFSFMEGRTGLRREL